MQFPQPVWILWWYLFPILSSFFLCLLIQATFNPTIKSGFYHLVLVASHVCPSVQPTFCPLVLSTTFSSISLSNQLRPQSTNQPLYTFWCLTSPAFINLFVYSFIVFKLYDWGNDLLLIHPLPASDCSLINYDTLAFSAFETVNVIYSIFGRYIS